MSISTYDLLPTQFLPLPTVLLSTEISAVRAAAKVVGTMSADDQAIAHRFWLKHPNNNGFKLPQPAALLKLFSSDEPLTMMNLAAVQPNNDGNSPVALLAKGTVSSFHSLLRAYRKVLKEQPLFSTGIFALARAKHFTYCKDAGNFFGVFPWMNAGINAATPERIAAAFDLSQKNAPPDTQSASTAVFFGVDRATAYVTTQEWEMYIKWRMGPTSTPATVSTSDLCTDTAQYFGGHEICSSKPLALPTAHDPVELDYQKFWRNKHDVMKSTYETVYRLVASRDELFPALLRIDFVPQYPVDLAHVREFVEPIALQRSAAFLHGVKWWVSTKPDVISHIEDEKFRRRARGDTVGWWSRSIW